MVLTSGEGRAVEAATKAVASPLLEQTIMGATGVLLNISGGESLTLQEVHQAADVIYNTVDPNANIVFGSVVNDSMSNEIAITVIATGFESGPSSLSFIKETMASSAPVSSPELSAEPDVNIATDVTTAPAAETTPAPSSESSGSEFSSFSTSPTSDTTTDPESLTFQTPAPATAVKTDTDEDDSAEFDLDVPAFLRDIG
jgi:cell division protein FtsZ